jgi:hypothetical protein
MNLGGPIPGKESHQRESIFDKYLKSSDLILPSPAERVPRSNYERVAPVDPIRHQGDSRKSILRAEVAKTADPGAIKDKMHSQTIFRRQKLQGQDTVTVVNAVEISEDG